uniref:Uncharacterized protein n=1 Tax=Amphimedon queenslandica TaxID=400682 RepID=A0A1X7TU97_AMPQE
MGQLLSVLMAYEQVIIQMAQSHGAWGGSTTIRDFGQQMAAGMPLQWAEVKPFLMAATVLGGAASTPAMNLPTVFHMGSSEGGVCPGGPGQLSQNASNDKDISI